MICKYSFGTPFKTIAVTQTVPEGEAQQYFAASRENAAFCFTRQLQPEEIVYGLGENVRGINKRGGRYISYNVDNPNQDSRKTLSLYGAHNFLILSGQTHLGFFFDTPARVIFDVDLEGSGELRVRCDGDGLMLYCIEGSSAYDVARQFLGIIGRSFLPPLWAFGYMQSRWGYKNQWDVRRVVEQHRQTGVPLDSVCLDIDYMDRFIDFSVNKRRFPDMAGFVAEMKAQNIRLVPIVDAGIKVEPGNRVYEEGVKQNFFCKDIRGGDFKACVWPGWTHFTDFFQPEASRWFGDQYRFYTELGFEGFWNDMNEPSIFHSEYSQRRRDKSVLEGQDDLYQKNVSICDYDKFTHNLDGKPVLHHHVHNLYGALMTKSSGEGLERLLEKRYLLFSRSSYIGAHRYGGIWTGDNHSRWDHLAMIVKQMPSLNMCGFLFTGCDIGGFGGHTTRELLLRWLGFGVFTPLMRNHSALGTRWQECYRFGDITPFRGLISLRYRLLPYLYSEFMKAALGQDMLFKPLAFEYTADSTVVTIEDQLLVGESIMVTPFLEKGVNTRRVYLPEPMTKVFYDGADFTFTPMGRGWHSIEAKPSEVVFFIRKGKLLPIGAAVQSTAELDLKAVTLHGDGDSYAMYTDDGESREVSLDNITLLRK